MNVSDEYGPNSQAVASALMALSDTRWLERVGESLEPNPGQLSLTDVHAVNSWDDALKIFDDFPHCNIHGILQAPCKRVDPIFERLPQREEWWQRAREEAKRYAALYSWVPDSLSRDHQDLL